MSITPDVGTIVEYAPDDGESAPATFRVTGWMREAPTPVFQPRASLPEILFQACRKGDAGDGTSKRMQWCLPNEATHLELSGVCGVIAPIEQCQVIGKVDWSEESLADYRFHATQLGQAHEMLF